MTGPVSEELHPAREYYLQILAGVTNNDIVLDPEGTVLFGQVIHPFDVIMRISRSPPWWSRPSRAGC
jgi:hypothetical protein